MFYLMQDTFKTKTELVQHENYIYCKTGLVKRSKLRNEQTFQNKGQCLCKDAHDLATVQTFKPVKYFM